MNAHGLVVEYIPATDETRVQFPVCVRFFEPKIGSNHFEKILGVVNFLF